MAAIHPVILAGGSGSRLWPLSRSNYPKQFLDPLEQGCSLLQACIQRARLCSEIPPLVIANKEHRFLLSHQLEMVGLGTENILLESDAKNTASSVLLAALQVHSKAPDDLVLILPADHYIGNEKEFAAQLKAAAAELTVNELLLLAVQPTEPCTQYGYLKVQQSTEKLLLPLQGFVEKPDKVKAAEYIKEGDYFWNSGVVLASASRIISLFKQYQPDLYDVVSAAFTAKSRLFDYDLVDIALAENISFDYAVLEKANGLKACVLKSQWDDLGTWPSLLKRRTQLGSPEMCFGEGKSKLIFTSQNIVVVDDDDLLLVADVDQLADLSSITDHLVKHGQLSLLKRIEVHRPWGSFKVLASGEGFLVKQLSVHKKQQISLQSHKHRVENWVVVSGVASVQLESDMIELCEGQSICIKQTQKHRLINNGDVALQIIEVQTGPCLEEADIIRYDDQYLRHLE